MASKCGRNTAPINKWMSTNVSDEVNTSRIPKDEWRLFDWNLYCPAETIFEYFKKVLQTSMKFLIIV